MAAKGGRGVHDSGDDGPDQPEGMADRQDQLARAEAIRIADQRRRKVAGLHFQQSKIQRPVPRDERGRQSPPIRQDHLRGRPYPLGTGHDVTRLARG